MYRLASARTEDFEAAKSASSVNRPHECHEFLVTSRAPHFGHVHTGLSFCGVIRSTVSRMNSPPKPVRCIPRILQDMLRIQRVGIEQRAAAIRLLRAQFEEHAISIPPERLEAAVARLIELPDRGALLLALDGDERVGLAALAYTWTLEHGGLVAWLDELYVIPQRRGEGSGWALLAAAIDLATRAGCSAIELEVDAAHRRSENLYRRAGFLPLARSRWSQRLPPPRFALQSKVGE